MRAKLDDTVSLLRELVSFPTISHQSNLDLLANLAGWLEAAGAKVELIHDESGTRANLFATIGPERDGGILLSGHTDVVPVEGQDWTNDPFELVEREDRLYGRGTCDMKGFIAACVAMAPVLAHEVDKRPLHFAFTYDEEIGCIGAQALVDRLRAKGIKPAIGIIGEPTNMRVIEGHKGCCEYTTRFHGLAGHGSRPELGVNAVEYAVRYLSRLLELREDLKARTPDWSRFEPPWSTINPGALLGGTAHNVIAEEAEIRWEMRPVQEGDGAFVREQMRSFVHNVLLPDMRRVHPGAAIVTETEGEVAGLEPASVNEARAIAMELTGANGADLVSFGTEAGIFQSLGMDVVVCGPGSIEQAHKPDEFIELSQLSQCLGMLERLGGRLM
ncbi:acetylornithine deacetylase [Rhodalgimonas zhirmunskyi]|uniref:Acetylornithine deacetylase n=1 Tax=Rhodalgimonas zhirmunskyi TaxID=2964767 RepID=A0AAJ1UA39_9RHOB|nr:acetylornithine deacetylase [Rhodoalgimonas zhirmunskyi]MDQ2094620.1 acetylornithine deacetylase [Rhodoalgimonas zhirmunskyi]